MVPWYRVTNKVFLMCFSPGIKTLIRHYCTLQYFIIDTYPEAIKVWVIFFGASTCSCQLAQNNFLYVTSWTKNYQ
jgi:hypothetical protein